MRRLLVAVVAVTLLPACGSFFRDRSLDYVKAESTPPLTLPQDVDTRPIKPLYPIPPASGKPVSEPAKAPCPPGMKGVLAAELPGVGSAQLMADMDAWGYTYRLGSSRAWFEGDAEDARAWLVERGLLVG